MSSYITTISTRNHLLRKFCQQYLLHSDDRGLSSIYWYSSFIGVFNKNLLAARSFRVLTFLFLSVVSFPQRRPRFSISGTPSFDPQSKYRPQLFIFKFVSLICLIREDKVYKHVKKIVIIFGTSSTWRMKNMEPFLKTRRTNCNREKKTWNMCLYCWQILKEFGKIMQHFHVENSYYNVYKRISKDRCTFHKFRAWLPSRRLSQ